MVRCQLFSNLNVVHVVLVAEFRESIRPAIPRLITLLDSWEELDIRKVVANSLLKLSEHGKISDFPA